VADRADPRRGLRGRRSRRGSASSTAAGAAPPRCRRSRRALGIGLLPGTDVGRAPRRGRDTATGRQEPAC
jgi:hypothetical protein